MIYLKDKSGIPLSYEGIQKIVINGTKDGNAYNYKYTRTATLNSYAVKRLTDGDVVKYLIQKKLQYLPTEDIFYFGFYESDFNEFATGDAGSKWVGIFITPKNLKVGETYYYGDMYY